jgi:hypothetical protein
MKDLWGYSSLSQSDDCAPVQGATPEEIGRNFASTVDASGLSEADLLQAALTDAEAWSDNPIEQGQYLYGLRQGLGL